ncbi:hypothetical protein PHYBLDRAFT_157776 [Phycomyces blakesleeanus NRRL 1555(-)]|uniref:Uncharacterized protein n=1 Tax=Phycomyces blakesleeanus (strain ATCC 8743b / DSM 1359 / FGSC 10004 / NBRC 33097 / NRRL 1555) TaxID=763407 RepID=A0A167P9H4_PHYB8|nr:hypothetical protein PHYBLDRAFT_157776 [Phycomyces blakesleeanus NRRL 1555(-)]OAD77524.1 hypothetical protein PHYBLDRAFT_157776 [Phycomyces blakesleeanus NRRL 1555(-)]|eukprot:XP_018295564.1 hypothetical protein PHYBLDRAFT_157776 [Phycomyces blakesleeanus NRRL 1555(-)]
MQFFKHMTRSKSTDSKNERKDESENVKHRHGQNLQIQRMKEKVNKDSKHRHGQGLQIQRMKEKVNKDSKHRHGQGLQIRIMKEKVNKKTLSIGTVKVFRFE